MSTIIKNIEHYHNIESIPESRQVNREDNCPICLTPPGSSGEENAEFRVTVTICNHVFCKSCLDTWLIDQSSCPICRAELKEKTITITLPEDPDYPKKPRGPFNPPAPPGSASCGSFMLEGHRVFPVMQAI